MNRAFLNYGWRMWQRSGVRDERRLEAGQEPWAVRRELQRGTGAHTRLVCVARPCGASLPA
jgi:hypothetical protein